MNLSSLAASAGKIDSCVVYSKIMADEQPLAPVVVLPADVPEAPPPPAVAAAVAEENSKCCGRRSTCRGNFSSFNLRFVRFGNFTRVASFPTSFFWQFLCQGRILRLPRGFVIRLSVGAVEFYLTRSLLAEC